MTEYPGPCHIPGFDRSPRNSLAAREIGIYYLSTNQSRLLSLFMCKRLRMSCMYYAKDFGAIERFMNIQNNFDIIGALLPNIAYYCCLQLLVEVFEVPRHTISNRIISIQSSPQSLNGYKNLRFIWKWFVLTFKSLILRMLRLVPSACLLHCFAPAMPIASEA